jgi:hypothetical protein
MLDKMKTVGLLLEGVAFAALGIMFLMYIIVNTLGKIATNDPRSRSRELFERIAGFPLVLLELPSTIRRIISKKSTDQEYLSTDKEYSNDFWKEEHRLSTDEMTRFYGVNFTSAP